MIRLEAENVAQRVGLGRFNWTWRITLVEPKAPGANLMCRLKWWCDDHVGARGVTWNYAGQRFYFLYRDDAMLFKLTWHGTDAP